MSKDYDWLDVDYLGDCTTTSKLYFRGNKSVRLQDILSDILYGNNKEHGSIKIIEHDAVIFMYHFDEGEHELIGDNVPCELFGLPVLSGWKNGGYGRMDYKLYI